MHSKGSPPRSTPPTCHPTSPLPQIHCFSISLQVRTDLPGISTEHSITIGTNPNIKAGGGNPEREKGPESKRKIRRCPILTARDKNPKLNNHNIYAENLAQAHSEIATSVSVSPFEPCLLDSVGLVLLVSLTPMAPIIPPPPLLWGSQSSI